MRFRRLAVTTGTTKFLIVGLDRPRHIGVQYKSDIGFVNPHTESDGGYHDNPGFSHKNVLICVTLFLIHTGVIRECTESPTFKKLRYCLGFLSRKAIDNATGSIVWGQEVQYLSTIADFGGDRQFDVGSIESLHMNRGVAGEHEFQNFLTSDLVRGRRGRKDWGFRKIFT